MSNKYESVRKCELCGQAQTKLVDRKGQIVQCKNCGLKFVQTRPQQEQISKIYDHQRENCPGWGRVAAGSQLMNERRFNFMQSFIQKGKILDVGAGLGTFLSRAQNTNKWQCFGTETSQYAIDFAQREYGLKLACGQLEDLDYSQKSFDAVTLWHVLEHLPYPCRAIQKIRHILKDDGFLFIAVPNDSWLGRRHFVKNALRRGINRLPIRKKLRLKKMYPEIDEPGNKHLFYFTPSTLKRLLAKCGLRIKEHSIDYDYDYEKFDPKLERKYQFDLLFCRLTGINLSNAILLAAQKE